MGIGRACVSLWLALKPPVEEVVPYVQDQANDPEPVPTAALEISQLQNDADAATAMGWAVITQPQAHFSDEELDAAMVPEAIRR